MQSLPPRLEALLAADPDQDFGARVRVVAQVAAGTIAAMGELELVQYEEHDAGSADLSMWEQVAPIIGSTISEVNTLCAQLEASFPPGAQLSEPRQLAVDAAAQAAHAVLKREVMNFGLRLRDPSVVGERWNLITELQIFRSRFRERIGRMVGEMAASFGECKRREVEPGYDQALGSALVVRSMTADLRRLMRARIHKVGEAQPTELRSQVQQIEKELGAFGRTAAWRALRAQDKRGILEFRHALSALLAAPGLTRFQLLELLEPFVEFVDTFAGISQRELLVQHDQEVLAAVGVWLERAMNTDGPEARLQAFKEALDAAQALYGRSVDFDGFIRGLLKGPPPSEALGAQLEQFVVQIAGLSQY